MKKALLIIFSGLLTLNVFSVQHIITNIGNEFSPDDITINLGDTVVFQINSQHNVQEVSQATYNSNGNTPLGGGFSLPNGGGMIIPTSGTHYYVCVPHSGMGMKGIINVVSTMGVENSQSMVFSFYPNPAVDVINVNFSSGDNSGVTYSVFNLAGQKMRSAKVQMGDQNSISIPVADLPRGIYMVTVSNGNAQRTKRIILQ